jgi:hypothetical protein
MTWFYVRISLPYFHFVLFLLVSQKKLHELYNMEAGTLMAWCQKLAKQTYIHWKTLFE